MSLLAFASLLPLAAPLRAPAPLRRACAMSTTPAPAPAAAAAAAAPPLVQYVVVRRDLGWPAGPVMAQAVHACVAATWAARGAEETERYCGEAAAQMRTVVLAADAEEDCVRLAGELAAAGVPHVAWREQPEDVVTAVAAAPREMAEVKPLFKKFKLFK